MKLNAVGSARQQSSYSSIETKEPEVAYRQSRSNFIETIIGNVGSVDSGRDYVIVEEKDSQPCRKYQGGLVGGLREKGRGGSFGYDSGFDESDTFSVPSNMVGLVVGKGGETIRMISSESGARCQVDKSTIYGGKFQNIVIKGGHAAVERAKAMIGDMIVVGCVQGPQHGCQSFPGAGGAGQSNYSSQWAEYYRSRGMVAMAESIEEQSQPQHRTDYSAEWVAYYRSQGNIKGAEAVEEAIRAKDVKPQYGQHQEKDETWKWEWREPRSRGLNKELERDRRHRREEVIRRRNRDESYEKGRRDGEKSSETSWRRNRVRDDSRERRELVKSSESRLGRSDRSRDIGRLVGHRRRNRDENCVINLDRRDRDCKDDRYRRRDKDCQDDRHGRRRDKDDRHGRRRDQDWQDDRHERRRDQDCQDDGHGRRWDQEDCQDKRHGRRRDRESSRSERNKDKDRNSTDGRREQVRKVEQKGGSSRRHRSRSIQERAGSPSDLIRLIESVRLTVKQEVSKVFSSFQ